MKKTIWLAAMLFIANYCTAQKFPYGTYYFMPKGWSIEGSYFFNTVQITPENIATRLYLKDLVTPSNFAPYGPKVDTIVRENQSYYFVTLSEHYGRISAVRFIVNIKAKDTCIYMNADLQDWSDSRKEAIEKLKVSAQGDLRIRIYTREQMEALRRLPSVNTIDAEKLTIVLKNILKQQQQEESIYKKIWDEKRRNISRSRLYNPELLLHFAAVGFSPIISGPELESMKERFKDNAWITKQLKDLIEFM